MEIEENTKIIEDADFEGIPKKHIAKTNLLLKILPVFLGFLVLFLIIALVSSFYIQKNTTGTNSEIVANPITQKSSKSTDNESVESSAEDIYFIQNDSLVFKSPKLIKEYDDGATSYSFYSVGYVKNGGFNDYEIIRGVFRTNAGPCKGPGCGKPIYARFLKKDDTLTLLPINSEIKELNSWAYNLSNIEGWIFQIGEKISLEPLQIKEEIIVDNATLKYKGQEEGTPNENVYIVFESSERGKIYTTVSEKSPQGPFYTEEDIDPNNSMMKWSFGTGSCEGNECLITNGMYLFNPDGTYLVYEYIPSLLEKNEEIVIKDRVFDSKEFEVQSYYYSITRSGCSNNDADYISISNQNREELEQVGTIGPEKRPILFFKDSENEYLEKFYEKYKALITNPNNDYLELSHLLNYEKFVEKLPVMYFEDDFGRLVRLTNKSLVIPYYCEPIIYLYPEKESDIQVSVDAAFIKTVPEYNNGWKLKVKPNGEILDMNSNKIFPYLFWEGTTGFIPKKSDGFVIKQSELDKELGAILTKLGLIETEIEDFKEAWLPELNKAPYYFMTFYTTDVIKKHIPMSVEPKPDTVIRVVMEYEPLTKYKKVPSFNYPYTPIREGFTLVEWGGFLR